MRYPPIDLNQLNVFKVPVANQSDFLELYLKDELSGDVCVCGHPAVHHKQAKCILNQTCACRSYSKALHTEDTRAFYQATFGPFESHALGRGMRLAENLGVVIKPELICMEKNCDFEGSGAMRFVLGKSLRLSPTADVPEIHRTLCYECADHMIFNGLRNSPFVFF